MASTPYLPAFLLSHLHIFLFYLLISVATGARTVFQKTNRRFRTHGEERQRSILSMLAGIVAKVLLFVLAFPITRAIVFAHESWTPALVVRAALCAKVLMVADLFDMTYRKVSRVVWVHHTLTFAACLIGLYYITPDAPDVARLWISVPFLFLGVGVGLTDVGGDCSVMLYYLAPPSVFVLRAAEVCGAWVMLGRVTQWSLILTFFLRREWLLLGLGPVTIAIIAAVMIGWGAAEMGEIHAVLGMGAKLRAKVFETHTSNKLLVDSDSEPESSMIKS
ncbi:hypothetical protein B0H16DRAFT_1878769 [Mycena metata]|uniref:Uncharacterized protein n=1 Tax=Mycena metata TaxID=1033252 RepID=A0AAD7K6B5_9AGAR|nr:hypothetical protein B0H16DRAFT_1878769 [Mycena metata]